MLQYFSFAGLRLALILDHGYQTTNPRIVVGHPSQNLAVHSSILCQPCVPTFKTIRMSTLQVFYSLAGAELFKTDVQLTKAKAKVSNLNFG